MANEPSCVLVIEHNRRNLELLTHLLQQAGYFVQTASNPEVLQRSLTQPHAFELAILDLAGFSVLIIEQLQLANIPFLILLERSGQVQQLLNLGAIDVLPKPLRKADLLAKVHSVLQVTARLNQCSMQTQQLVETTKTLQVVNQRLSYLATQDALTGVGNRRGFDEGLWQAWQWLVQDTRPLSLIMLDVDFFKAFNDTYGHLEGDRCLQQVAQAIRKTLKRSTDLVTRYGGEEFAVILPDTDLAGASAVAEEIREQVEALAIPHNRSLCGNCVTISLGVASVVPDQSASPIALLTLTDEALYQAKRQGRNQVQTVELERGRSQLPHFTAVEKPH